MEVPPTVIVRKKSTGRKRKITAERSVGRTSLKLRDLGTFKIDKNTLTAPPLEETLAFVGVKDPNQWNQLVHEACSAHNTEGFVSNKRYYAYFELTGKICCFCCGICVQT